MATLPFLPRVSNTDGFLSFQRLSIVESSPRVPRIILQGYDAIMSADRSAGAQQLSERRQLTDSMRSRLAFCLLMAA